MEENHISDDKLEISRVEKKITQRKGLHLSKKMLIKTLNIYKSLYMYYAEIKKIAR